MSEYQRYEFMTIDKPLTEEQVDEVENLSSHIEASATQAVIEYHWGDFKHDPIKVLHKYFDGFLYWANWGSPQFALRFPHGVLPGDLIENYDYDEYVTFTRHADYDILDLHFVDEEPPNEWVEYELGSLIPIREELIEGDLRALYVAWLAAQARIANFDDEYEDEEDEEGDEEYDETAGTPPIPPGLGKLTAAQRALVELLGVPQELLVAAAVHSTDAKSRANDDFAAWVELLPEERRKDYLVRFAQNEAGLSRKLAMELRELGRGKANATSAQGEKILYTTLLAEARAIEEQREREARALREKRESEERVLREKRAIAARERAREERLRRLQDIYEYQDVFWLKVDQSVARGSAVGYDEAVVLLNEMRDSAIQHNETDSFRARFQNWVRVYLRRPALLKRLQEHKFTLPDS